MLRSQSRKFGKAGVGNFGQVGVGVGHFTSDSANPAPVDEVSLKI